MTMSLKVQFIFTNVLFRVSVPWCLIELPALVQNSHWGKWSFQTLKIMLVPSCAFYINGAFCKSTSSKLSDSFHVTMTNLTWQSKNIVHMFFYSETISSPYYLYNYFSIVPETCIERVYCKRMLEGCWSCPFQYSNHFFRVLFLPEHVM